MSKSEVYGFVAEPHRDNYWLSSPASKDENGVIRCHDLSGFLGSWNMKEYGVFFPCETDSLFCKVAMKKSEELCRSKNV